MEGRGMGISEKVSESLLAQLDRLEAVDASNADALRKGSSSERWSGPPRTKPRMPRSICSP